MTHLDDLLAKVDDSLLRDELRREFERQGCTVPEWAVEIQARLAGIESRLALRDNNPVARWIDSYSQEQLPNTATGEALDRVCGLVGISRHQGETDEQLRERRELSLAVQISLVGAIESERSCSDCGVALNGVETELSRWIERRCSDCGVALNGMEEELCSYCRDRLEERIADSVRVDESGWPITKV